MTGGASKNSGAKSSPASKSSATSKSGGKSSPGVKSGASKKSDGGTAGADVLRPDFAGRGKDLNGTKPGRKQDSGDHGRAGATPASKTSESSRPSAAARRAKERESVRYSVRQPVISWVADDAAADAAKSKAGADSGADGSNGPVPAKSFSGRMLALAVVLITIIVLLAPTVKTYLEQRGEINALQDEITAQEETRAGLENQLSRWDDPAYVKQQARNRLFLVMPGETRYLVMGAEKALDESDLPGSPEGDEDDPWVDALFQTIKRSATD